MESRKPQNLQELIEQGYAFPAMLPAKNDFLLSPLGIAYREKVVLQNGTPIAPESRLALLDLNGLNRLKGYFAFLTSEDYGAISPLMWNTLFENRGLNLRAIYLISDPKNAGIVIAGLKSDPKYLGGGFGSGWKEQHKYLDRISPEDLSSVNNIGRDAKTGQLVGFNTDISGLLLPLENKLREIGKIGLEGKAVVMIGGGGVGKELPKELVRRGIKEIVILNRTVSKAEEMAAEANRLKLGVAEYGGEDKIRYYLVEKRADAVLNVSHKGAEPLQDYSAFASADTAGEDSVKKNNETSLQIAREIYQKNAGLIIYDITLPKSGNPKTLQLAKEAGLKNLIHGTGMVVNQGIMAVKNVETLNPKIFGDGLSEEEIRRVFTGVVK